MKSKIFVVMSIVVLLFAACREQQWDEHGKTTLEGADMDLLNAIRKNPELSKFYDALVKTGYDRLLTMGNNFTVLAPSNNVWNVDMNNEEILIKTVGNHIAYDKRLSTDQKLYQELMLVSGKVLRYGELNSFGIGGAQITSGDHPASNGVLHVLDKIIELKLNVWEHISDELAFEYAQANFLKTEFVGKEIDYTSRMEATCT